MRRNFCLKGIAGLLAAMLCFVTPAGAAAAGDSAIIDNVSPQRISINVHDADVRDVLSAVAVNMGYSIVYSGDVSTITMKLENVTPAAALDYLLKSMGLSYLQEGSTLVVGKRETLTSDFARSISITRFNLAHITSGELTSNIQKLNLPVTVLTMEANEKALWVQGLPADIAKVRELVRLLDVKENAPKAASVTSSSQSGSTTGTTAADTVKQLSSIKLKYLTAYEFNRFLKTLGVDNGLCISDDDDTLWVYANAQERGTINDIRTKVDTGSESLDISNVDTFSRVTVTNISKANAVAAIQAVCPGVSVISVDNAAKSFFINGNREDITRAKDLIYDLDRLNKGTISTTYFSYDFTTLTAAEAVRRLQNISFGDNVKWYATTHEEFSKTLFVYCNSDYKAQVEELLKSIDQSKSTAVNLPVFRGSSAVAAAEMQDYVETMLGDMLAGSHFATQQVGGKTVLYLKGASAETVQLVEQIIARLSSVASDTDEVQAEDLSTAAFLKAQTIYTSMDQAGAWDAYGKWVAAQLAVKGATTYAGASTFAATEGRSTTAAAEETAPQASGISSNEELTESVSLLVAQLFSPSSTSANKFTVRSNTSASDVLDAVKAAMSQDSKFSNVRASIKADQNGVQMVEYTPSTVDAEGQLNVSLLFEANEYYCEYAVELVLPKAAE